MNRQALAIPLYTDNLSWDLVNKQWNALQEFLFEFGIVWVGTKDQQLHNYPQDCIVLSKFPHDNQIYMATWYKDQIQEDVLQKASIQKVIPWENGQPAITDWISNQQN